MLPAMSYILYVRSCGVPFFRPPLVDLSRPGTDLQLRVDWGPPGSRENRELRIPVFPYAPAIEIMQAFGSYRIHLASNLYGCGLVRTHHLVARKARGGRDRV